MDIKAQIEDIVKKVKDDPKFMEEFQQNPVKAVESIVGVDLPDDQINGIVDGVKAKISVEQAGGLLGKLFGKK